MAKGRQSVHGGREHSGLVGREAAAWLIDGLGLIRWPGEGLCRSLLFLFQFLVGAPWAREPGRPRAQDGVAKVGVGPVLSRYLGTPGALRVSGLGWNLFWAPWEFHEPEKQARRVGQLGGWDREGALAVLS